MYQLRVRTAGASLTLSAHAPEGYSSHLICYSVD